MVEVAEQEIVFLQVDFLETVMLVEEAEAYSREVAVVQIVEVAEQEVVLVEVDLSEAVMFDEEAEALVVLLMVVVF